MKLLLRVKNKYLRMVIVLIGFLSLSTSSILTNSSSFEQMDGNYSSVDLKIAEERSLLTDQNLKETTDVRKFLGEECIRGTSTFSKAAKEGERMFWSGEGALNAATNYAKSTGSTTLEMTRPGQNLQNLITSRKVPWAEARPMWVRLSTVYAKEANGTVHFFPRKTVNPGSIWLNTEKNILLQKGVNIFTH